MTGKTFQELLRERERDAFVGRSGELLGFRSNLSLFDDDPSRQFITAISGQGGMGKTTLLNQYRGLALKEKYACAWTDEDADDVVATISRLADGLGGNAFDALFKEISRYRSLRHDLESNAQAPVGLARIVASAAGRAGTKLARRIPVAGVAFDFVDEDAVGEQLAEAASFVLQKTRDHHNARLILEPVDVLSPLLVKGLAQMMTRTSVALFFDTFEETGEFVEPWLIDLLGGRYGELPLNFHLAIAGRNQLDPNLWWAYEGVLSRVELEPFDDDEAREFLARHGIRESGEVQEMLELSAGLPILLVSMTIGDSAGQDPSGSAVERVLRSVPEPLRRVAIQCAFPRMLNRDIATVVLGEEEANDAFDWLIEMPFVRSATDGWRYHAVIRREFLKWAKRDSPHQWEELHTTLAAHFEKEVDDASGDDGLPQTAFNLLREDIYHDVCSGKSTSRANANALCLSTWDVAPGSVRLWATPLRDAEEDAELATPHWGARWIEADQKMRGDESRGAIELMTQLLRDGGLSKASNVLALIIRGDLYYGAGHLIEGLRDLDRAADIDPDDPRIYYERSWTHTGLQEYERSILDAEKAGLLTEQGENDAWPNNLDVAYLRASRELFDSADVLGQASAILEVRPNPVTMQVYAQALREAQMYPDAIREFRRMGDAPGREHISHEEIARTYLDAGEIGRAKDAYREALPLDWECARCWSGLGRAMREDPPQFASREALRALGPDAESDEALPGFRALGIIEAGFLTDGIVELERAIKSGKNQPEFHLWLARARLSNNDPENALVAIEVSLQLRPEWPEALMVRGLIHAAMEDHEAAIVDWQEVDRMNPADARIVNACDRGLSYSIVGDYEEAIKYFEEDLNRRETAEAIYNRAVALARAGDPASARAEIDSALAVVEASDNGVICSYGQAGLKALLGFESEALSFLADACARPGSLAAKWARSDPAWLDMRGRPQFEQLVRNR